MNELMVTKRDGRVEPLDLEKLHKVTRWATEGITGVSASEIEIKSHIQFYPKIKTVDIQETLIKSAADLISEETPNYQFVAGRLINYHLRKEVYDGYTPCHIVELIKRNVENGFYDPELLELYTEEEWDKLNSYIKHVRDEDFTYVAMEQWRGKYLVQNRTTGEILETPQMAYMLISAVLFSSVADTDERLKAVKEFYDLLSTGIISLPTPIMAGVRTSQRQFSSCVLIETDDSLDSINATTSSIVKYVSQRAGIGIGAGAIRAIGSPIRNGQAYHTGVTPFYRLFQSAILSCSQGAIRKGSGTLYVPFWHYEIDDIMVLKNNKGTDDNRVRHIDYNVQFNRLFYKRLAQGKHITLFSPSEVPGLYEAFFEDNDKFEELYEKYERSTKVRKKKVNALEFITTYMLERKGTGRIYSMNTDHCNTHSSFITERAPIRMSNLCVEVTLPTKPLSDINDPEGRIQLCTLGAINWGLIKKPEDFEKPCTMLVRAIDNLMDYQTYPILAAELATKEHRPMGIGIINFAYWLAKNDLHYNKDALATIDEYAEAWSYYLIKASVELAKEKGPCEKHTDTKYSQGILPIDTYRKTVDNLVPHNPRMPWDELREDLKTYGIRNSTLMALMPSETSSQISNSTNGIEPPRSFISVKASKDGALKQVVPEYRKLKNKYDMLWDMRSPRGYLEVMAVLQKYIDQSISTNTSYNPELFEDEKLPMQMLIQDFIYAYSLGIKTLYYFNTYDGQEEVNVNDDEDCDGCKI